jgi:hypothetical protein
MKNKTAVDLYIIRRHEIEIQSRLGKISAIEYDEELIKAEQQSKEMEKEQIMDACWAGGDDGERYYNETFGGNNE